MTCLSTGDKHFQQPEDVLHPKSNKQTTITSANFDSSDMFADEL